MIRLIKFPRWYPTAFNPRTKLKPSAAKLFAVSNALWPRPDSLRRVISMARGADHSSNRETSNA